MNLEALDLNLLLAFEALLAERNVTRAAERIGLSQPAMSNALARLRRLTGDPLFVRAQGEMRPTRRAQQLAGPVVEAMARLREAFAHDAAFQPADAVRTFHLAMTDYAEAVVLPSLIARVAAAAPGVTLRTLRPRRVFEPPREDLESGDLDFALGFFPTTVTAGSGLVVQQLFEERFVCIARRKHPGIGKRLTLAAYLRLPQIRLLYPGDEHLGTIDTLLRDRGHTRHVALTVPHFLSIAPIVATTDLIGNVPERLARAAARSYPLRIERPPIAIPTLHFTALWHQRHQHDPAHRWLRELIAGVS